MNIRNGICLTQRKYCLKLLHEFGMLGCMPVKTPLDLNIIIKDYGIYKNDVLLQNVILFQKLVGKLIYLTITRLGISYTVQVLSPFMHSPRKSHLNIGLRLLHYLKSNPSKCFSVLKSRVFNKRLC